MSKVIFGSDLHIGHKNIMKFRSPEFGFPMIFKDEAEHREWIFDWINDNVQKRDTLYLLGDICFTEEALLAFKTLPGRKVLVKGNHDIIKHPEESKVYDQVLGLGRYKRNWISHAPVHPVELRGRFNLHGHVHSKTLPDNRYFNCCVENLMEMWGTPLVEYSKINECLEESLV